MLSLYYKEGLVRVSSNDVIFYIPLLDINDILRKFNETGASFSLVTNFWMHDLMSF